MRYLIISLLAISISFCSSGSTDDLEAKEILNLNYGSDDNQTLDLYLPEGRSEETPLFIIIHGGGWAGGDKSEWGTWPKGISESDFAVANINYRLVDGNITWQDQISDIRSVVDFLSQKARNEDYIFSSETIILMGHSAGAHLSLLYTYKYDTDNRIKSVISMAGPTDLTSSALKNQLADKGILLNQIFDDASEENEASPILFIKNVPTLLFHGKVDDVVPYSQSENLAAKMLSEGYNCKKVIFSDTDHSVSKNSLDSGVDRFSEINNEIVNWIKSL
ncbi:MAG: alpha/beta fold hydrolase [Spirochaetes bacterium]|nr:alpha/beta fold hydrolase [Spirochaetota bacterium]